MYDLCSTSSCQAHPKDSVACALRTACLGIEHRVSSKLRTMNVWVWSNSDHTRSRYGPLPAHVSLLYEVGADLTLPPLAKHGLHHHLAVTQSSLYFG